MYNCFGSNILTAVLLSCTFEFALGVTLGVQQDGDSLRWGSVARFATTDIPAISTSDALASLAGKACDEMLADCDAKKIKSKNRPTAMTAMVVDEYIYLSSSMKGSSFAYGSGINGKDIKSSVCAPVKVALQRCSVSRNMPSNFNGDQVDDGDGNKHGYGGNCGEVMTLQQYCFMNDNSLPPSPTSGQRPIVTVKCKNKSVMPPCNGMGDDQDPNKWGCSKFLGEYPWLKAISDANVGPTDTLPAEIKSTAGCISSSKNI